MKKATKSLLWLCIVLFLLTLGGDSKIATADKSERSTFMKLAHSALVTYSHWASGKKPK